ncbi:MAG: DUF4129 domain-containing protein [Rubripirellula sp.]
MTRTSAALLILSLTLSLPVKQACAWQDSTDSPNSPGAGVSSQPPDASKSAVESALGDAMWYDAEANSIGPVRVEPIIDDSLNRDSRWLPKAKRVKQSATGTTPAAGGGTGGGGVGTGLFGSGLTIGNVFGWVLLIMLVAFAVGLLVYAISKTDVDATSGSRGKAKKLSQTPDEQMLERMKHLPAELRRTDVNLRSEAERLMREGKYDQAIILLFGHQLLLLDRIGMLRLNRGKTNRKYVRETRSADRTVAKRLQGTVTAFERSYFGRHTIGQREFSELWNSNEQLEADIERHQEVAA